MAQESEHSFLEKVVDEVSRKIQTLFSLTGLRSEVLPGIRISVLPAFILLEHFRTGLLTRIGLKTLAPAPGQVLVGVLAVFTGVASWFVSGWIFDPPYDWLYGPDKPFTRHGGRYGPFPSGYQLNVERRQARVKLGAKEAKYTDPNIPIYGRVFKVVEKHRHPQLPGIKATLTNAKTVRNAILPVLGLVYVTVQAEWYAWAAFLLLALVLFVTHCSLRLKHSVDLYEAYNAKDVPAI